MPHICAIFALRPALGPCSFARRPTQKNVSRRDLGSPANHASAHLQTGDFSSFQA